MQRNCWRRRGSHASNKPSLVVDFELALASFALGGDLHQPSRQQHVLGDSELRLLTEAQHDGVDAVFALRDDDSLTSTDVDPANEGVTFVHLVASSAVRALDLDLG